MLQVRTAASVIFFRPELDDFIYASIGAESNEMPLTVLSALTRLGVDPWEEATELSGLPKEIAAQRLASLIARLPGGFSAQGDPNGVADRLIELLPRSRKSDVGSAKKASGIPEMSASTIALICAVLALAAFMVTANLERPTQRDEAHVPGSSAVSPPQTRPQ